MPLTTDPVFPHPTCHRRAVVRPRHRRARPRSPIRPTSSASGSRCSDPSTVWFLRRLADHLDRQPEGFTLDLVDTARSPRSRHARRAQLPDAQDHRAQLSLRRRRMLGTTALAVRRRLAPLTRAQVERLPDRLQREHTVWLTRPRDVPTVEQMKDRARPLALSMLELGEDTDAIERQLHHWRFHPAVAHEAVRWALGRAHAPHRGRDGGRRARALAWPSPVPPRPRPAVVPGRPRHGAVGFPGPTRPQPAGPRPRRLSRSSTRRRAVRHSPPAVAGGVSARRRASAW